MTRERATNIVRSALKEILEKTIQERGPARLAPVLYEIQMQDSSIHQLTSSKGSLGPQFEKEVISRQADDPANHAFFVDLIPNANWEHRCEYIFIHDSGKVTTVSSMAPPSLKHGAKKRAIPY
jgi:hypothetical protein